MQRRQGALFLILSEHADGERRGTRVRFFIFFAEGPVADLKVPDDASHETFFFSSRRHPLRFDLAPSAFAVGMRRKSPKIAVWRQTAVENRSAGSSVCSGSKVAFGDVHKRASKVTSYHTFFFEKKPQMIESTLTTACAPVMTHFGQTYQRLELPEGLAGGP